MDLVTNQTTKQMDHEISNGFGFGGVNASELFRRWTGKPADASESLASYSFPQSMKEMTERTMCPHGPCRAVAPPPVAGKVGHSDLAGVVVEGGKSRHGCDIKPSQNRRSVECHFSLAACRKVIGLALACSEAARAAARIHHPCLRRRRRLATRRAGAAACTAHWRTYEWGAGRCGGAGPSRGIPGRAATVGLDRRPERANSLASGPKD